MRDVEELRYRIKDLQDMWVELCGQPGLQVHVEYRPTPGPRYWYLVHDDGSVETQGVANTDAEALEEAAERFTALVKAALRRSRRTA